MRALLLSPAVILLASAARLLIISNYDTSTAITLASSGGLVSTLLGTIIPLLPLFLPALLIVLVVFRRWRYALLIGLLAAFVSPAYNHSLKGAYREARAFWNKLGFWPHDGPFSLMVDIYSSVSATIISLLRWGQENGLLPDGPIPPEARWILACALVALLLVLFDPPWRLQFPSFFRSYEPSGWFWRGCMGRLVYALIIASVSCFSVIYVQAVYKVPFNPEVGEILRRPWIPAEKIQLPSEDDQLVGYTLSTSDGWHVLLLEETRTIIYLRSRDVVSRESCHVSRVVPVPDPLISLGERNPNAAPDTCRLNPLPGSR